MSVDPFATAVGLVKEIWNCVQNVKVYQRRCRNLAWRCNLLMDALMESMVEPDGGIPTADALREARGTLESIHSRVLIWADLSIVKSILAQQDIREGVDDMHRRIDTCMTICHVRISQAIVRGQRARAQATEHDRHELQETLQVLHYALSRYIRESRHSHTVYQTHDANAVIQRVEREINAVEHSTISDHDLFGDVMGRLCTSLEHWELRHHVDVDNPTTVPFGDHSSDSRGHVEVHSQPGSSRWRINCGPLRFPWLRSSRHAFPESFGCPQIAPLDLGGEINLSFPSQILLEEPSFSQVAHSFLSAASPTTSGLNHIPGGSHNNAVSRCTHQPTASTSTSRFSNTSRIPSSPAVLPAPLPSPRSPGGFSVLSEPSPVQSRYSSIPTAPHDTQYSVIITHQPSRVSVSSISNSSGTSSPLEVYLNIRNRICLWGDDTRFIRKATMKGLVQYLLLNPKDTCQHDAFFVGHLALISSQDLLKFLIREFEEASDVKDYVICMKVMRLVKSWLTNKNVIICNSTLSVINNFALTVNGFGNVQEVATEVVQLIADKASLNYPRSPIPSSFRSRPDLQPNASQLAVALATLERERYLCIVAAEYIAYARNLILYSPNLKEALSLNQRITNWATSSILQLDHHEERCRVKIFFMDTAEECIKIRNFSSMSAILHALQSDVIDCLKLTHNTMPNAEQKRYRKLTTLLKRESNYSTYRTVVEQDGTKGCIPWHDIHLHDINTVLKEKNIEERDEPPLINFEKWVHLMEKAVGALRYRDLPLAYDTDSSCSRMAMAYLQWQLRSVTVDDAFDRVVRDSSTRLKQREEQRPRRDDAISVVGF